jgi:phospholipase/lecithinase/hemolysin
MPLASFTGIYAFGDSLVDPGNALELADSFDFLPFVTPESLPTADKGYYQGRFTDGYNYTDLISNKYIGIPTKPVYPFGYNDPWLGISFDFVADPNGNNLNFAYGGAQIRKGDEFVPDMDDQTDAFKDAVDGDADPNALHIFTFGGNDIHELVPKNDPWVTDMNTVLTHLAKDADEWIEEIRDVINAGARTILATGIPDIGIQPYYDGTPSEAARRAAATQYAEILDQMIQDRLWKLNLPGVQLHFVSFNEMADTLFANLEQLYPASDIYSFDEAGLVFFDRVHPTAQLHALAAAYLIDDLNGAPAGDVVRLTNPDFVQGGSIAAAGEVDKLVFSLAANTTYTFEMLGLSSGKLPGLQGWQVLADPSLKLVGPGGTTVATNDDGGFGLDARIQFTTGQAGLYTLQLTGVGVLTGSYTLQAENAAVQNDTYSVSSSSTLVVEGAGGGNDSVFTSVSYALAPGSSIETLATTNEKGKSSINLTGNELAQALVGNAGSNVLDGKGGSDTLWGKLGKDSFAFTTPLGSGNIDTLADYNARDDTILLDDAIFRGLPTGTLASSAFRTGTAAADTTDRIIFDPVSHALYFDPDGLGGQGQLQIATVLGSNVNLTASDFVVI